MRLTPSLPLVGYAALAGLILGLLAGFQLKAWMSQGRELIAVRSALAAERAASQKDLESLRQQAEIAHTASRSYLDELATLRAQRLPVRPVRLCRESRSGVPEAAAGTPGISESASGTGMVPPGAGENSGAGPDISRELYALADRADSLLALCRGAQQLLPR